MDMGGLHPAPGLLERCRVELPHTLSRADNVHPSRIGLIGRARAVLDNYGLPSARVDAAGRGGGARGRWILCSSIHRRAPPPAQHRTYPTSRSWQRRFALSSRPRLEKCVSSSTRQGNG